MKFNELWLREWINPKKDSLILNDNLTMSGLEVNKIEPAYNNINIITIGNIVKYLEHHKKNKNFLIKTKFINNNLLNIILIKYKNKKYKNIILNINNNFKKNNKFLKKTLIKHVLFSYITTNLKKTHQNLIKLHNYYINNNIKNYLQLKDNIFNFNLNINRPDYLCILGIIRDIATINKIKHKCIITKKIIPLIKTTIPTFVDEPESCPKYLTRVIKNININIKTPLWIKEKLKRCNLISTNIIHDIIKYVTIELGQPINIYDYNSIDKYIVVKKTYKNEQYSILKNKIINILPNTLIIKDNNKILAIAGTHYNYQYKIKKDTKNIIIECACFNPIEIKKNIKNYKINKNYNTIYNEKGIDPFIQSKAMERVSNLLINICKGETGPIVDITNPSLYNNPSIIILKKTTLTKLVDYYISDKEIIFILNNQGFKIKNIKIGWEVLKPSWRFDINIEEDVIEEIIKIYGYNLIPNISINNNIKKNKKSYKNLNIKKIKQILINRGYQEIITYSFVNPKIQKLIHSKTAIKLKNPISKEMSVMRLSLWTGLINTIIYNQNRQQKRIRLFESGLIFTPDIKNNIGIRQDFILSGIITGLRFNEHWNLKKYNVDFYDIKGDIESILKITNNEKKIEFKKCLRTALHPKKSAIIYLKKKIIGYVGAIHPKIINKLNLNENTFMFELIWNKIIKNKKTKLKKISQFPFNQRDITIIINNNIQASDILKEFNKNISDKLVKVTIFDVYKDNKINKNFKNLSIRLIIQDLNSTLTEKEISKIVKKYLKILKYKFNAYLKIKIK